MRKTLVAAACLLVALAACGSDEDDALRRDQDTPTRVTGLVTDVQMHAGKHVIGFTVESQDGDSHEVAIASDVDYDFDLHHLVKHQKKDLPVKVTFEKRSGTLYALSIDDA